MYLGDKRRVGTKKSLYSCYSSEKFLRIGYWKHRSTRTEKSEGNADFKEAFSQPELSFLGFTRNTIPLLGGPPWGLGMQSGPGHAVGPRPPRRGAGARHNTTLSGESASLSWNILPRGWARVTGWGPLWPSASQEAPSRHGFFPAPYSFQKCF